MNPQYPVTQVTDIFPPSEAQYGIMQVNRGGIGTRCEQEGDHGLAMGVVP